MKKLTSILTAVLLCVAMIVPAATPSAAGVEDLIDLKPGAWYITAVRYVVEHGLMTGTGDNTFSPSAPLTRAMAVLIFARVCGADLSEYAGVAPDFTDVKPGKWYTKAVAWAVDNELAVGLGDRYFGTNVNVTREQLALMMMKLCDYDGIENYFPNNDIELSQFPDGGSVSKWARTAMGWAVKNGFLSGDQNGKLNPKNNATRAEAAQLFYNLHYVKENGALKPDNSYANKLRIKQSDTPRIVCWGDSLTEGWGVRKGLSYPDYLKELTDYEVINYGISSDTAKQIALRLGSIPTYILPVTIPADKTPVRLTLVDDEHNPSEFGFNSRNLQCSADDSINPVYINGVKGELKIEGPRQGGKKFYFVREEEGEPVRLTRLTRLVTHAMEDRRSSDIIVIWSGSNDFANPDNIEEIIEIQRGMIEFCDVIDRFISIGFTAERMITPIVTINSTMRSEYGENYLDVRDHLRQNGLTDAGLTPTQADLDALDGEGIPPSLLCSDGLHGNPIMNQIVASLVADKLDFLGLISAGSFDHIHSFKLDSVDEPGCITYGTEHYLCDVCQARYDSDLNPLGHECDKGVNIEDVYDDHTGAYLGKLKEVCKKCGEWHILVPKLKGSTIYTVECPVCGTNCFEYEFKRDNFCSTGLCPNDGATLGERGSYVQYSVVEYQEGEHSPLWEPDDGE